MPRKQSETTESIIFNGITFRRYPSSSRLSERRYYRADGRLRKQGISYLHRYIWELHNGPIPEGYHVHHKNEDPLDNSIDNLELLPGKSHLQLHAYEHSQDQAYMEKVKENLDRQRAKASEWHSSKAGREWHSERGKLNAALQKAKPRIEKQCEMCGATFHAYQSMDWHSKFCSKKCYSKFRRDSGIDDVTKVCPICGREYRTNKYRPKKTCGKDCGAKLSGRTRTR